MTTRQKARWFFAPVIAGGALLASGCTDAVYFHDHDRGPYTVTQDRVWVTEAPPPARYEVVRRERPGYVWVNGRYRHDGRRYYWQDGHYERIPRRNAHYVPGRWEHRDKGYIWIEGRWD
jgi:hypothetical protein